ncbi:MAG: hypothetical protein RL095_2487 [Verrucomicrobiota bacterium]|jgi:hypothetical protein
MGRYFIPLVIFAIIACVVVIVISLNKAKKE